MRFTCKYAGNIIDLVAIFTKSFHYLHSLMYNSSVVTLPSYPLGLQLAWIQQGLGSRNNATDKNAQSRHNGEFVRA